MAVSFATDILPMFREIDIEHMAPFEVYLDDYAYMSDEAGDDKYPDHGHARQVYCRLAGTECGTRMPIGGPYWTAEQLQKYQDWMDGGFSA
jgi:hypothetical protein